MTVNLMVYGLVMGIWLAAAAFFLDRGLRALGKPTRWAWALAMLAVAVVPFLSRLRTDAPSADTPGSPVSGDLLYALLAGGPAPGPDTPGMSALMGPLALGAWVLGSALMFWGVLWTYVRLRRTARRWEPVRLGGQDVLVSEGLGPAVIGLFRPTIVLPPWALAVGDEKLGMILLHEGEHRMARDPGLLAMALFLVALMPWNPALWWMIRRLHLAVEGDCDGRVLARGVSARAYGDLLLELASGTRGIPGLAPALTEARHTFLERRLLMIRSNVRRHRWGVASLAAVASAGLLVLACETPTPPAEADRDVAVEGALTPAPLADAEEGYFLVRKTPDGLENLGPVSAEKLRLIQEGSPEAPGGLVVTEEAPGSPVAKEEPPSGVLFELQEAASGLGGVTPKPLIVVDGVILSDPDALASLDLEKEDIARVEVVKGDAARAMYGERAAGGVIQIFTKR